MVFFKEVFSLDAKGAPRMELCSYIEASEFLWGLRRRFLEIKSHLSLSSAIHADADPNPALFLN
jgi:hypothetical protein